jgi:hypothetical protein
VVVAPLAGLAARVGAGWLALASLLAMTGSCSVMVDVDRVQCVTDADCTRRGAAFSSSVCHDSVCRPDGIASCEDAGSCAGAADARRADACAGARCQVDARARDAAAALRDARAPREPDEPDARDDLVESSASNDAGAAAECRLDDECAALGKLGAMCVDGVCWTVTPLECAADRECGERGPEYVGGKCLRAQCRPNPRWRCERTLEPTLTEPVGLKILVRSSLSLDPLRGIRASLCDKLDLTCAVPIADVRTDDHGMLYVDVPADFAGYVQFDDPGHVPALYFLPAALPADGMLQPAPLMPKGVVDALALSIGSRIDPERGHMMLISEDCYGAALPGVSFESPVQDDETIQFYVRDLLPTTSAKETAEVGNGGYLNFPPGNAVMHLIMNQTKLRLTTASLVVRPGFITVAYLRPELR